MRVGIMQYPQTLPLNDHEVVLTFDDGPAPPHTDKILDIMAAECVKATYFMVGEMARHHPDAVRRVYAEGHTIGTHSEDHPLRNGEEFADYIRHVEVPGSEFAFALRGQQMRYLAVNPRRPTPIREIEFVKGPDNTAPIIMAVTTR